MATSSLETASTPSPRLSTSAMPFLRMHRVFQERSGGATELRSSGRRGWGSDPHSPSTPQGQPST